MLKSMKKKNRQVDVMRAPSVSIVATNVKVVNIDDDAAKKFVAAAPTTTKKDTITLTFLANFMEWKVPNIWPHPKKLAFFGSTMLFE